LESSWPELPIGTVALPEHAAGGSAAAAASLSDSARATLEGAPVQAALKEAARTGQVGWVEGGTAAGTEQAAWWKIFTLPLSLPPRLLLLGAGPDATPIVELAARLNWKVTVLDHRPAYADPSHFPAAERVVLARPEALTEAIDLASFAAAVVMSHHLPSDLAYLQVLAASKLAYVGLLGPAPRREKLLADLGERAQALRPRLHAPVGLALGGRSPESIALAIVAEIHAFVHGANARSLTAV
jgi:xanthine/CO dehydrogenase XdhC/CoxF family maturation factor